MRNVRNFGIVALIALGVWALPGGNTAAQLFGAALFVVITVGIGLLAGRFYLDNHAEIHGLGHRWRLVLYVALGVIVLAMAATPRLWNTGGGTALWLALIAASLYALFRVFRQWRVY